MSATVAWALLLIVLPLMVGFALWSTCGAITATTDSRCRNPRPGPLHRCHHHGTAIVVRGDLYGLLALGVAYGGYLVWHEAYPGPVIPRLIAAVAGAT